MIRAAPSESLRRYVDRHKATRLSLALARRNVTDFSIRALNHDRSNESTIQNTLWFQPAGRAVMGKEDDTVFRPSLTTPKPRRNRTQNDHLAYKIPLVDTLTREPLCTQSILGLLGFNDGTYRDKSTIAIKMVPRVPNFFFGIMTIVRLSSSESFYLWLLKD